MLSVKVVVALCLLVACEVTAKSVEKAAPKPCCTPDVYEGRVTIMAGEEIHHHTFGIFGNTSFHLDMKNSRFASRQQIYIHGRKFDINIVEANNTIYHIVPKYKRCKKFPAPPLSNCLSDDSKYLGNHTLGGIGSSLGVDVWGGKAPNISTMYSVAVTKDKCVPVFETTFTKFKRVKVVASNKYFDIKEGIADPSVFTLPDYCTQKDKFVMLDNLIKPAISQHQSILSYFRKST